MRFVCFNVVFGFGLVWWVVGFGFFGFFSLGVVLVVLVVLRSWFVYVCCFLSWFLGVVGWFVVGLGLLFGLFGCGVGCVIISCVCLLCCLGLIEVV